MLLHNEPKPKNDDKQKLRKNMIINTTNQGDDTACTQKAQLFFFFFFWLYMGGGGGRGPKTKLQIVYLKYAKFDQMYLWANQRGPKPPLQPPPPLPNSQLSQILPWKKPFEVGVGGGEGGLPIHLVLMSKEWRPKYKS